MTLLFKSVWSFGSNAKWHTDKKDVVVMTILTESDKKRNDDLQISQLTKQIQELKQTMQAMADLQ